MRGLYRALGVRPDADAAQIKAAYRNLAKRAHPDLNAGDGASSERFKEIHEAYRALRDPQARAVHDLTLALQREKSHRRRLAAFATMSATFFLTVVGSLLFLGWQQKAERSAVEQLQGPPLTTIKAEQLTADHGEKPSHRDVASVAGGADKAKLHRDAPAASADPKRNEQVKEAQPDGKEGQRLYDAADREGKPAPALWTTYQNLRFGFSLSYPHNVFTVTESEGDDSVLIVSHDGRGRLRISATRISRATTLPAYRRKLMEQYGNAVFDRTPSHKTWFALSGSRGEEAFYERVACSCDGRALHAWQVTYPPAQRAFYEPMIAEIRRSYRREGEDEEGLCRRNRA